jgi:ABC-type Fe3+/spermidine/putrescine transport system ATPase subunit
MPAAVSPDTRSIALSVTNVSKSYGRVRALHNLSFNVTEGRFFVLFGPSSGGKTTTLRMIAGFERPSEGHILLDGKDVSDTPPNRRNVNTVFQSYALFSHLTVVENVAFGLRFAKVSKGEARSKVGRALALVRMQEKNRCYPTRSSRRIQG